MYRDRAYKKRSARNILQDHYPGLLPVIDSLIKSGGYINVAIDGNSGAGKSYLASMLSKVYACNIFHMDDYFLTPDLRTDDRLSEIGGNVDYIRFREEIIDSLTKGTEFQYRPYNCRTQSFEGYILVEPKYLNIIEGVYSMHPTLVGAYDLKVFLGVEAEEQSRRILKRNGKSMHTRFVEEWIPLENEYFNQMNIKEKSDLVYYPVFMD